MVSCVSLQFGRLLSTNSDFVFRSINTSNTEHALCCLVKSYFNHHMVKYFFQYLQYFQYLRIFNVTFGTYVLFLILPSNLGLR